MDPIRCKLLCLTRETRALARLTTDPAIDTSPSYSPDVSQVVHATATMGDTQREAGVSVSVRS